MGRSAQAPTANRSSLSSAREAPRPRAPSAYSRRPTVTGGRQPQFLGLRRRALDCGPAPPRDRLPARAEDLRGPRNSAADRIALRDLRRWDRTYRGTAFVRSRPPESALAAAGLPQNPSPQSGNSLQIRIRTPARQAGGPGSSPVAHLNHGAKRKLALFRGSGVAWMPRKRVRCTPTDRHPDQEHLRSEDPVEDPSESRFRLVRPKS